MKCHIHSIFLGQFKWPGLFTFSLLVGTTLPGTAGAQATSSIEPKPTGDNPVTETGSVPATAFNHGDQFSPLSWKYGDWRGFFTFTGQLRYNDNITALSRNTLSDLIGVAAPALNLEYVPAKVSENTMVHLDYMPQFVGYWQHRELDTVNQLANLNVDYITGRSEFRFSDALAITTDPAVEQTQWGQTTENTTEFSWAYQATEKTSITIKPHQDWSQVEHGLEIWQYGVGLELGCQLTDKFDLLGSYDVSTVNSSAGSEGLIHTWLGGFSWEISGRSRLDLRCGIQTISLAGNNASGTDTAPDLSLAWNYQIGPKTTLELNLAYDSQFSKYTANQINKTLLGRLTAKYAWTEKVGLELREGVQSVEQTSIQSAGSNGGTFNYWTTGCGVVYQFNQRTELRLDYDYQARTASQLYSAYDRNIIQLQLQHRF